MAFVHGPCEAPLVPSYPRVKARQASLGPRRSCFLLATEDRDTLMRRERPPGGLPMPRTAIVLLISASRTTRGPGPAGRGRPPDARRPRPARPDGQASTASGGRTVGGSGVRFVPAGTLAVRCDGRLNGPTILHQSRTTLPAEGRPASWQVEWRRRRRHNGEDVTPPGEDQAVSSGRLSRGPSWPSRASPRNRPSPCSRFTPI